MHLSIIHMLLLTNDTDPTPIPTVIGIAGTYSCLDNNLAIATDGSIDLMLIEVHIVTRSLTNCTGTATQEVLIMNGNNCNTINFNTTKDAIDNGGNNFQLTRLKMIKLAIC